TKSEARNSKQIRMFKYDQNSKQLQIGFEVLDFPSLRFIWLSFVSDFDIRISDFVSLACLDRGLFLKSFCKAIEA
ncbi:MAG: hypothetical protein U1E51_17315, partial [Candidatus Binatia bacterium]|nr:hypothetical protein [Candidatus Binatia bacterium]